MSSSKGVPDAWDDDWVDKKDAVSENIKDPQPPTKLSKAERRRQQLELNKKLWEAAEAPDLPYLVQSKSDVPLQSGYTSIVKVLSRNPAPVPVTRHGLPSSAGSTAHESGDGDDGDDNESKGLQMTADERVEKARKELEEKQRKYEEARQKIFGTPSALDPVGQTLSMGSARARGAHLPGSNTGAERPRGRGRGGPSSRGNPSRQLYDPNGARNGGMSGPGQKMPADNIPIRSPRGPDGSGRGGRGFTNRGDKGFEF